MKKPMKKILIDEQTKYEMNMVSPLNARTIVWQDNLHKSNPSIFHTDPICIYNTKVGVDSIPVYGKMGSFRVFTYIPVREIEVVGYLYCAN